MERKREGRWKWLILKSGEVVGETDEFEYESSTEPTAITAQRQSLVASNSGNGKDAISCRLVKVASVAQGEQGAL